MNAKGQKYYIDSRIWIKIVDYMAMKKLYKSFSDTDDFLKSKYGLKCISGFDYIATDEKKLALFIMRWM